MVIFVFFNKKKSLKASQLYLLQTPERICYRYYFWEMKWFFTIRNFSLFAAICHCLLCSIQVAYFFARPQELFEKIRPLPI